MLVSESLLGEGNWSLEEEKKSLKSAREGVDPKSTLGEASIQVVKSLP